MLAQPPPGQPSGPTPMKLPALGRGKGNLGLMLGAIALAVALVAVALAFVIPGPSGSTGPAGSSGIPNYTLWAVVGSNGVLSRSSGVASSTEVSAGQYQIVFDQMLTGCTVDASLGTTGTGSEAAGSVTFVLAYHSLNTTNVTTLNASGVVTAGSFHIVAICPGGLTAEVASNGTFVSGDGVDWTLLHSTGTYYVVFNQDVASCAYIVALGTGGVPPSGSATAASLSVNHDGVWVNTYDTAGTLTDEPFTVAVYCT